MLLGDLVLTALVFWGALWALRDFGIVAAVLGEDDHDVAVVLRLFSPLALFFYSTFVTSVWVWGYVFSVWLMRPFARLPLRPNYAEHPTKFLALGLGATTLAAGFAGSAAFGALTSRDAQSLSAVDRALCALFQGEVCVMVRGLTEDEQTRLRLTREACRGGVDDECVDRDIARIAPDLAFAAGFYRLQCETGEVRSCIGLASLFVDPDVVFHDLGEAMRLYRLGCDGGMPWPATGWAGCRPRARPGRQIIPPHESFLRKPATAAVRSAAAISAGSTATASAGRQTPLRQPGSLPAHARVETRMAAPISGSRTRPAVGVP